MYEIQSTHMKFIDKICNLLVLMNLLKKKYRTRRILKGASDISKVLRLKDPSTLMLNLSLTGETDNMQTVSYPISEVHR